MRPEIARYIRRTLSVRLIREHAIPHSSRTSRPHGVPGTQIKRRAAAAPPGDRNHIEQALGSAGHGIPAHQTTPAQSLDLFLPSTRYPLGNIYRADGPLHELAIPAGARSRPAHGQVGSCIRLGDRRSPRCGLLRTNEPTSGRARPTIAPCSLLTATRHGSAAPIRAEWACTKAPPGTGLMQVTRRR